MEKRRSKRGKKGAVTQEELANVEVEEIISAEEHEERRIKKIIDESFLGELISKDDNITDISFNGTESRIQHNKLGRMISPIQPTSEDVAKLATQIAMIQGKEFTDSDPILDTEIAGLRINAVHKVVSPSGTTMAARISKPYLALKDLSEIANPDVAELLKIIMASDTNLIISGQTGSGKTEVLKRLVGSIRNDRKITLLEDTMDSYLKELYPKKDINSWRTLLSESRKNKIQFQELIKAGLRNNPEWMIISEIRGGEEAYDFLQSALTGHTIITTIHANGAEAIPSRIRGMIGQVYDMNPILLGQDIVENIRFGMHMEMVIGEGGKISRRVREIVEYLGYSEKGLESRVIYKVQKQYDEKTGTYKEGNYTQTLSDKTLDILKEKEMYHLVPDVFRYGEEKIVG